MALTLRAKTILRCCSLDDEDKILLKFRNLPNPSVKLKYKPEIYGADKSKTSLSNHGKLKQSNLDSTNRFNKKIKFMKKILMACLILAVSICNSAEINLRCTGSESFYSSSRGMNEKLEATIEVKFDDLTNKVLYVDPTRLFGCYENSPGYKNSCDCQVNNSLIACSAESTKDTFNSKQTVSINRYTGRLNFSDVTIDKKAGDSYSMFKSGDLQCEHFSKKKF